MIRLLSFACVALLVGCSDQTQLQRTVNVVGADKLRAEAIAACSNQFPWSAAVKIHPPWPPAVRAFQPLSVWAEPDGVYLLLDSDAAGERGVFVPRVQSETDPICGPKLKHAKLAPGIYTYDRVR